MKKVSILSTFYNDIKMLKKTMDSVLSQDYPNLEHVIIDAASTDGSVELIKQYEAFYKQKKIELKWISEKDSGIYEGFNKSFRNKTGDYFIFATDPYSGPHIISEMVETLEHSNADGLYGGMNYILNGKIIRNWSGKSGNWRFGWIAATPTLLIKKECIQSENIFNLKYKIVSDYDLQIRLFACSNYKFVSLPKALVNYSAGGSSNGGIKAKSYAIKECYKVLKDNEIPFAWFTNLCKTMIALFAYGFASHKKIKEEVYL